MSNDELAMKNRIRLVNGLDWITLKSMFPSAYCYLEYEVAVEHLYHGRNPRTGLPTCKAELVYETRVDLRSHENPRKAEEYARKRVYEHYRVVRCVPELNGRRK